MFGVNGSGLLTASDAYEITRNLVFVAILCIACTPLPKKLFYKLYFSEGKLGTVYRYAVPVVALAFLTVSIAYLVDSSFNPFLYFRF